MAKFIVRIPDSYAQRFSSNVVEIDADSEADATFKAYQFLNIPATLLSVTSQADESKALQDAATKLENLETSTGENVVESQRSWGRFGPIPYFRTNQVAGSELGQATGALDQFNLNRQVADLYALGEGETASLTPEQARVISPTVRSPYYVGGETDDLLRLDELESDMFARLAKNQTVPQSIINEIYDLRDGVPYDLSSPAAGLFDNVEGSNAFGLFRDPNAFPVTTTGDGYSYLDEPVFDEGEGEQTSIQNLFRFNPGSVAGDALSRVFDPSKGPVDGTNFEVQPPAGYVPPTGTVPATGTVPVTGTMASPAGMPIFSSQDLINDPQGYLTAAGQRLAFRNVFGEPAATGVGPLASYLQRQTFPLTQAFRASNFANIGREQAGEAAPQSSFEEFLRSVQSQPTGLGGAYGQALQDVGYLRGLQSSQVPTALAGVFNPEQAAGTRDARALLEAAQRGKYSNLVSSAFRRPSEDDLFADYVLARQDAAIAGAAPQNFLNFAASRYGL